MGNGYGAGNVNLGQLAVVYAAVPMLKTTLSGTLLDPDGVPISGATAAALASIGMADGQFLPQGQFQLNGCALTATSCVLLAHDSVPVQSAIQPINFGSFLDPNDDPDLLAPNISDRDY
jgi:hypothetical protein